MPCVNKYLLVVTAVGGGHGGQTANENGQASVTTMKEAQELLRAHDVSTNTNCMLTTVLTVVTVLRSICLDACNHMLMPVRHTLAHEYNCAVALAP
jgi:hypothetical protein